MKLRVLVSVALAGAGLVWLGARYTGGRRVDSSPIGPTRRLTVRLPPGATLALGRGPSIVLSNNGRTLVYVASLQDTVQLFQRVVDEQDSVPIPGTEGASDPFFSPDDRWVGFFAAGALKKTRLDGGAPITLGEVEAPRGAAWAGDDTIILAPRGNTGLWRIPATGGKPEPFTTLAEHEISHRWPHVTPDGKFVIYTNWITQWETAQIAAAPIGGGARLKILTGGGHGRYADVNGRGYLFYTRSDDTELAVPLDSTTLTPAGPPTVVASDVVTNLSGGAQIAVSASGAFAYVPGLDPSAQRALVWVDRSGRETSAADVAGMSMAYEVAPDGRRVAHFNLAGPTRDLWTTDLATKRSAQLTFSGDPAAHARVPRTNWLTALWSADGRQIAYAGGDTVSNLYLATTAGDKAHPTRLTTSPNLQSPTSWSHDGRTLVFTELDPLSDADIWVLALDDMRRPAGLRPFLRTPDNEDGAVMSPDGRWLAYHSNESGRFEVFVQPFPGGGRRWRVSTDGGAVPHWSPRGDELFYRSGTGSTHDRMNAVTVITHPEFRLDTPRQLFDGGPYETYYAVSPDRRFLMVKRRALETGATAIHLIVNAIGALEHDAR